MSTEEANEQKKMEVVYLNIGDIYDEESSLRDLLPPLDELSREKLYDLIKEAGAIRDPLSVAFFKDKNYLLDGYNRISIAKELIAKGHNFSTVPVVFYDIQDEVAGQIWMVENQIGKRNMGTFERIKMVLQLEPKLQAEARERQRAGGQGVEISSPAGKVRVILAEMAGKSEFIIQQAKRILDTKDEALIAIADDAISINKADKLAKLEPNIRAKKVAAIVKSIAKKQAKADIEEPTELEEPIEEPTLPELPETVTNGGIEYNKVSDMSYITKTDDLNFEVVSFERTLTGGFANDAHDMLKINSAVSVTNGSAIIRHTPCILNQKSKAVSSFVSIHYSATSYDRIVSELLCVIDNMKVAKKLIDSARSAFEKEGSKEKEKADELAKKEALKADKLKAQQKERDDKKKERQRLKDEKIKKLADEKAKKFAERAIKKSKTAINDRRLSDTQKTNLIKHVVGLVTPEDYKEKQHVIDKIIRQIEVDLNCKIALAPQIREHAKKLLKAKNINIVWKYSTAEEVLESRLVEKTKGFTAEQIDGVRNIINANKTIRRLFVKEIFNHNKIIALLKAIPEYMALNKKPEATPAPADAPETPVDAKELIDTPTHAPAEGKASQEAPTPKKKVATKKKPATKKPTKPADAPEPQAVTSKNKRGSKQTGKK